jgi:hypothetical protein
MPLPSTYSTGTASVANGATTITFSGAILGTASQPNIQSGDLFVDPAQPLVPAQRIDSVDYDALTAELWVAWPGASMTSDPYEVRFTSDPIRSTAQTRRLLEQLSVVDANGRGLFYIFDDGTADADPGGGKVRFNNADPSASTGGYLDNLDANGATVTGVLDSWDDQGTASARGQVWFRSVAEPSTFHAFKVTGTVTDGTGYRKLVWTYVGGSGSFAAGDEVMAMFSPQGADGTNAILGVWQGSWQTATAYDVDDLVEQGGSTYICLEAHTSGTFSTDLAADKWELAVEKGETGDQGQKGWSPQLVTVLDGERQVLKLNGYVGGAGSAPTANVGEYLKSDGTFTATAGDALDTRGASFNWRGAYSGATAYAKRDAVRDQGASWIALQATTGNAPPSLPTTSNAYWDLMALPGANGAGTVASVGSGTGITVDSSNPANPSVALSTATQDTINSKIGFGPLFVFGG